MGKPNFYGINGALLILGQVNTHTLGYLRWASKNCSIILATVEPGSNMFTTVKKPDKRSTGYLSYLSYLS